MTVPGREPDRRRHVPGGRRRHPPLPRSPQAGRLPRAGPQGPPIRRRARQPRAHLKTRRRAGPGRAGRGQLERRPPARARCTPSIQRIRARRGHQVAITAAARKLACLFWILLWREEDYAFGQPSLTAKKLRRLEIMAGAPRWQDRQGVWIAHRLLRDAELNVARQAEHAYAQTVRDRQAAGAIKAGASATPGRASQQPTRAKPRGRPQAPDVCTSLRQSLAPTRTIPQEATTSKPPLIFIRRREETHRRHGRSGPILRAGGAVGSASLRQRRCSSSLRSGARARRCRAYAPRVPGRDVRRAATVRCG